MRELTQDPEKIQKAWSHNSTRMEKVFNAESCLRDLEDTYAHQEPKEPSRLFRV
jgi:hypothetical protein